MHTYLETFGTGAVARIPLFTTASAYDLPSVRVIDGFLSDGRWLAHPLNVLIEYDEDEVVVSEPRFHIHASAPTEAEAIASFRRIFSGYLDLLSSREGVLSSHLHDQLEYLRSMIRMA
ncbi:MAG: hypothetical protein WCD86_27600 [Ktedonobacteraceae bacterium]